MESVLRERLAKYIPPKDQWTPVDEALYGVDDIYNVPEEKAKKLRTNAIRYAFRHHYENNRFYHEYCKDSKVTPDDIKTEEDLKRIPLIPDTFFKSYPSIEQNNGKDFIKWLDHIYTGHLPEIELKKKNPNYDDVIEALSKENICLTFSSGTSGRFTFIPRDRTTYNRMEFGAANAILRLLPYSDVDRLLPYTPDATRIVGFIPNPSKTNLFVGRIMESIVNEVYAGNVEIAIDRALTVDLMRISTGRTKNIKEKIIHKVVSSSQKKIASNLVKYLQRWKKDWEEKKIKIMINGVPVGLDLLMTYMEDAGLTFNFEDGITVTGGGWKTEEGRSISPDKFRKRVRDNFGIPEENCRDLYGMNEGNLITSTCEGHYRHTLYSLLYPIVLDEKMEPAGFGEYGRYAFLDPLANSYPGFIVTGDRVKLMEHCPECDRPGPVIEPPITRMPGSEERGCAQVLGKMLEEAK